MYIYVHTSIIQTSLRHKGNNDGSRDDGPNFCAPFLNEANISRPVTGQRLASSQSERKPMEEPWVSTFV